MWLFVHSQLKTVAHLPTLLTQGASAQPSASTPGVWLAIILLAAFVVAVLAGTLTWATKRQSPAARTPTNDISAIASAVLYAVVAFGGTIGLLMAVYSFVT